MTPAIEPFPKQSAAASTCSASQLKRKTRLALLLVLAALATCFVAGCDRSQRADTAQPRAAQASEPSPVQLRDITRAAGISFRHNNGAFGLKWMPEVMGSGVAFIDYDGDGYQDIFLVNGRDWTDAETQSYKNAPPAAEEQRFYRDRSRVDPEAPTGRVVPIRKRRRTTGALYRNNGDNTFRDVTREAGLDVEMFGMGAAVGDYDNDGRPDLYVTALGRNYLFRNQSSASGPKFTEVAALAGVQDAGWSTSAAWLDYDKDGRLDLFVCHYLQWTPARDPFFAINLKGKSYTGPRGRDAQKNRLFRNIGGGKFQDVSRQSKIVPTATEEPRLHEPERSDVYGISLGVLVCDFNNDSWPDIVVANDATPNHLWANYGDGTFAEVAVAQGIAYDSKGEPRAGMGIDGGDVHNTGRESILIGNFHHEMLALFENRDGAFADVAQPSGIGDASRSFLTFGCEFVDLDLDGWLDIFAANGHVQDNIDQIASGITFAQRPLVFLNRGEPKTPGAHEPRFREITMQSGPALQKPLVARGLAHADIDLDGDADVIISVNGGPAILLQNDAGTAQSNVLRLVLRGTKSNRSGLGAVVKAKIGGLNVLRRVRSGSSYCSQSELPISLGLGAARRAESLTIDWPSGTKTTLRNVDANQILTIQESQGIARRQPLRLPPAVQGSGGEA